MNQTLSNVKKKLYALWKKKILISWRPNSDFKVKPRNVGEEGFGFCCTRENSFSKKIIFKQQNCVLLIWSHTIKERSNTSIIYIVKKIVFHKHHFWGLICPKIKSIDLNESKCLDVTTGFCMKNVGFFHHRRKQFMQSKKDCGFQ